MYEVYRVYYKAVERNIPMKYNDILVHISRGGCDSSFKRLYPGVGLEAERRRYAEAVRQFGEIFGTEGDISLFSVPGRSELSGNHTDHNHGCVIAASIDLDIIAVARPRDDGTVRLQSRGFAMDHVTPEQCEAPDTQGTGHSSSLIAGVINGLRKSCHDAGGFDAYTTSEVLKGSGLSSSAAFEDMIGTIENYFYNDGKIGYVEISQISQYAENRFFGKPCGLMDQVACAAGGIVSIDFADPSAPVVEKVDFDITGAGYCLCIVDTGGNHADLTADYAAVPAEMKAVAAYFGREYLRDVDENAVLASIPELRKGCGDRAVLRALHFYAENRRVALQREALRHGRLDEYFTEVTASGRSSFCYLQNVFTTANVREQGLSLALCLAERFFEDGVRGAYRVHGGGFAGTVQAYVPADKVDKFRNMMDGVFGAGACTVLHIRPDGAARIV